MKPLLIILLLFFINAVFTADEQCEECRFAVELLHDAWGDKITTVCSVDIAMFICVNFHIEDHFVCQGIMSDFQAEFMYVFNQIVLEPHEICGIFFTNCGDVIDPLVVKWLIPMPENKPAFVPKQGVKPGMSTVKVLHLSDLHVDMYYTPGTETQCGEPQCCRVPGSPNELDKDATIKQPAGYWGMVGNCDAPYYLLTNMLNQIQKTHTDLDYIMVTGDLTSHAVWEYNNVTHMAMIHNLSDTIRSYFPTIPVYFAVGNHEGVPIDNSAPHSNPQRFHMDWLYGAMADSWHGWIPNDQINNVKYNGCFMKKLFPGLRLISLNSLMGDGHNFWLYINQTDPDGTMTWLIDQLYAAEADGDKVHIIAHIPGADSEALEGWSINYYNVVNRFANTISAQFMGHTHLEEFYLTFANPEDSTSTVTSVIWVAPSLTPYSDSYPAYRVYTIDGNYPGSSFQVIDWEEHFFNLTVNNANPNNPIWQPVYASVNAEYGLSTQTPDEYYQFIQRMRTDNVLFEKYRENHYTRNQYDGLGPCDEECKRGYLCSALKFHHSDKLCAPLGTFTPKPVRQSYRKKVKPIRRSREELIQLKEEWKEKKRNSEECPL